MKHILSPQQTEIYKGHLPNSQEYKMGEKARGSTITLESFCYYNHSQKSSITLLVEMISWSGLSGVTDIFSIYIIKKT